MVLGHPFPPLHLQRVLYNYCSIGHKYYTRNIYGVYCSSRIAMKYHYLLNTIPKRTFALVPSSHGSFLLRRNRTRTLAFADIHEKFPQTSRKQRIDLELWYDRFPKSLLHSCCFHIRPWFAWTTGVTIIKHVRSAIFKRYAPLSDMLHSYFAITIHLYQLQ